MMSRIFTLIFLTGTVLLSGQTNFNNYNIYTNAKQLKIGDQYYQNNFTGIKSLMNDLKANDHHLHTLLMPEFERLQKRQQSANAILGVGLGGMTILTIAAGSSALSAMNNRSTDTGPYITLLTLGAAVGIGSALIYSSKRIKHQDVLDFTNNYNSHSKENKIEFSITPEINFDKNLSAGLSINLTF